MRGWRPILICVIALLGLSSCGMPQRNLWESLHPESWTYQSIEDDLIVVEVIGPVGVDVHSFNGSVFIEGKPNLDRANVKIIRESTHGSLRKEEAESSLGKISYTVKIVPGELGQVLQIKTTTTHVEPHFQRAHVFVELPEVDGVYVRTKNGKVFAKHVSGMIDIANDSGDVRLMTTLPLTQPVTIINYDGDVDCRIRGESSGRFDCQTVGGTVTSRVKHGEFNVDPNTRDDTLHATLNEGTNRVILRTVNGDIRISVIPGPERVGDRIFE